MSQSKIEWCDEVINPTLGCTKCAAGCMNCYAIRDVWRMAHNPNERIQRRFAGLVEKQGRDRLNWTGKIKINFEAVEKVLRKKKPTRFFVNSMSDLFHKDIPFEFIDRIMAMMTVCPQHTFMVLTKRPKRMREYFEMLISTDPENGMLLPYIYEMFGKEAAKKAAAIGFNIPSNIWLGTSISTQDDANKNIPELLGIKASVHFISAEPLLEFIDLTYIRDFENKKRLNALTGALSTLPESKVTSYIKAINWIICGGESGSNARPMHPDWPRSLRDQCQAAGVPFFFKQWGEYLHIDALPDDFKILNAITDLPRINGFYRVGKKTAGRMLDGREWNEFPNPSTGSGL